MTDKPIPPELEREVRLAIGAVDPERIDGVCRVLLRLIETDPESNVVFGNIPPGEAEDYAAAVVFAKHTHSPVILDYVNTVNMAKRAEGAKLFTRVLDALKSIGRAGDDGNGFWSKFRRS